MEKECLLTFKQICKRPSDLSKILESHGIKLKTTPLDRWYTEDELVHELRNFDAVLAGGDRYTARVIESAPRLRVIARIGVGYDNVDVDAATRRGVYVTWTPIPELAKAVAEETFALMLSVLRRTPQLDRHVREGGYDVAEIRDSILDAYPLTLGIVGLGRIGLEVARRARGFEMNTLYYDSSRRQDVEKDWGIQYVSLEDLLKDSDIITIHTPLTPQTRGLIGEREISLMKKGAILINTSRGSIVQEEPLYKALIEGKLGGAGLSVLSQEPPTPISLFYRLGDKFPNTVLLPHIGIGVHTARAMIRQASEDVVAVLEGRQPKYLLNKEILTS